MTRPVIVAVWGPGSRERHWSAEAESIVASFADRVDVFLDPNEPAEVRAERADAALVKADGLIFVGWGSMGIGMLSAERLTRAPRLRFIASTTHYHQAEFLDVETAVARGIGLSETAPIMSPWVAEYELALALSALRQIPQEHGIVGSGGWVGSFDADPPWPDRLQGRRAGLASFGEIHHHLARLLTPFDVEWEAFDPFVSAEWISAVGGRKVDDLAAMAARSDILFIATPPNPTTLKMIDRAVIEALPTGAVFVLVSRMAVVDQEPLLERLQRGELRAAIDVYEPEPPPDDSPLRHLPNVIHTPHRAGHTRGAHNGVVTGQCAEARRFFSNQPLLYPIRRELVQLFER